MKQSEIWKPVVIEGGKLPIENDQIRRELRNASRDHLKSVRDVYSAAGVQDRLCAALVELNAVAVEFYFMYPARAYGRFLAQYGLTGR